MSDNYNLMFSDPPNFSIRLVIVLLPFYVIGKSLLELLASNMDY